MLCLRILTIGLGLCGKKSDLGLVWIGSKFSSFFIFNFFLFFFIPFEGREVVCVLSLLIFSHIPPCVYVCVLSLSGCDWNL